MLKSSLNVKDFEADYRLGHPAVYVGTYGKYNEGSIYGAWLDLTKFSDYEEFMEVCRLLHKDEEDAEFMIQDYECYPKRWYSESGMDEETFDKIRRWWDMDDEKREAFEAYVNYFDDEDEDSFNDKYCGHFDSEEEYAEQFIMEMGGEMAAFYDAHPGYFNIEAFARDLFYDFTFVDGYVFRG